MKLAAAVVLAACGREGFDPNNCNDAHVVASDYNVAFVTSTLQVPGTFGSDLSGADQVCAARAAAAGLPGTYIALLSTTALAARSRLIGSRGWVRADGKPLLDRPDDIGLGKIFAPLAIDETGAPLAPEAVATGSHGDGTPDLTCGDYTSTAGNLDIGFTDRTTIDWLDNSGAFCNQPMRLYCFGVGKSTPLTPAETGRRAFVTVQPYVVDAGGLATADALCTSEAQLAGLTGSFRALLPTSTATSISRFSLTGANWVRLDGVALAASPFELEAGHFDAPLNVNSAGAYLGNSDIATGVGDPVHVAFVGENCNDWTDPASNAMVGLANSVSSVFFSSSMGSCTASSIYCFEQ